MKINTHKIEVITDSIVTRLAKLGLISNQLMDAVGEVVTQSLKDEAYPFKEGDIYMTIDPFEGLVESVWDDVSEEMHDEDPDKKYFVLVEVDHG